MDLKVGDVVRLKKPANVEEYPYWDEEEMDKFDGRLVTVKTTDGREFTTVESGVWVFANSWAEPHPAILCAGESSDRAPSPEITLRDQFAMAALTGLLVSGGKSSSRGDPHVTLAIASYATADAMIAERERGQ